MSRGIRTGYRAVSDFADALSWIGAIILSAVFVLSNMVIIIGIVVVGLLMIFNRSYLIYFEPWIIASVLYIVALVLFIAYRISRAPATLIATLADDADDDRFLPNPERESGRGSRWPALPAPSAAAGFPIGRLAAPGSGLILPPAVPTGAARSIGWTPTGDGGYRAEIDGYTVLIGEKGPNLWFWAVFLDGRLIRDGLAPSLFQAEALIVMTIGDL